MSAIKNVIDFPAKSRQLDNHRPHTISRGDGKVSKMDRQKSDTGPVVKITLLNYDPAKQDEYSQKFMSPLITALLKQTQLAQAE